MPYLVAAVVLLTAITLLNLLITTAAIRRMRLYEARVPASGRGLDVGGLPRGAPMPSFRGRAVDGTVVTDQDLRDKPALIGFFSTECSTCLERAPEFQEHAIATVQGGGQAVAVVIEGSEPPAALVERVDAAIVVLEPVDRSGPVTRAFDVHSFPSYFVIDPTGTITSRELDTKLELALFGEA